ncbi:MAG TPA: hypothetical protein VFH68_05440 [Polyangia bacterium]|jgi:hypothetical protein|nr:hypothetical protein [Polyangia bacterium]
MRAISATANVTATATVRRRAARAAPLAVVHLALAGAAVGACGNFEDVSTVLDLRVLGIKAEPPEIYVDRSMLASQTDPFVSTFTALVVDPRGAGRPVSYSAIACPREIDTVTAATGRNGVVCEHNVPGMTPTSLDIISPDTPAETTDPGPEHQISFELSVPPPLLELAFMLDPFGAQGFQLPIVVQLELGAGTESVVATKRVIFSQQLDDRPAQAPNQNPVPGSIRVYPARDAQRLPIDPMVIDDGNPIELPPGGQLWFEPMDTPREGYSTRLLTRDNPPQVITQDVEKETLRFAFFATAGTFAPPETTTVKSLLRDEQAEPHLESQYTAPAARPDNPMVTVWIVTHDERGGASWVRRQLTIGAP